MFFTPDEAPEPCPDLLSNVDIFIHFILDRIIHFTFGLVKIEGWYGKKAGFKGENAVLAGVPPARIGGRLREKSMRKLRCSP